MCLLKPLETIMPQLTIGYYATYRHAHTEVEKFLDTKECSSESEHYSGNGNFCQECGAPTKYESRFVQVFNQFEITNKIDWNDLPASVLVRQSEHSTHFILPIIDEYSWVSTAEVMESLGSFNTENATIEKFNDVKFALTAMIGREPDSSGFGRWHEED